MILFLRIFVKERMQVAGMRSVCRTTDRIPAIMYTAGK